MTLTVHPQHPTTSLRQVKYTLAYIFLIPLINWSFTWAPMVSVPGLANWVFNPVTIVTGLVLVVRDFAQRGLEPGFGSGGDPLRGSGSV